MQFCQYDSPIAPLVGKKTVACRFGFSKMTVFAGYVDYTTPLGASQEAAVSILVAAAVRDTLVLHGTEFQQSLGELQAIPYQTIRTKKSL